MSFSRRFFLEACFGGLAIESFRAPTLANTTAVDNGVAPLLLQRARSALEQHRDKVAHQDYMGVIDFSLASRVPRFHVVALADFSVRSHWVAHGRGSDPMHTGWLESFSNEPKSNATSAGAYLTAGIYAGAHGPSVRLEGLDPTNDQAFSRAIVVHSAWYVSEQMIERCGMLGRSQGCFAVAAASLQDIFMQLAPGRLIYADKAAPSV